MARNPLRLKLTMVLAGAFVVAVAAFLIGSFWVARPLFDETLEGDPLARVRIASPAVAWTFARTRGPLSETSQSRTLLVTEASRDGVEAVDLGAALGRPVGDPLELLAAGRLDELPRVVETSPRIRVAWSRLGLPFEAAPRQIAAGTNFAAHAEEVGHEGDPFLFPKLSRATAWSSQAAPGTRLDYEAELCAVTLSDHGRERPAPLGFVLCNDFTERWTLVREMDFDLPMGLTGFPEGKGGPGRLPIGPLLVVPRSPADFHERVELELYVNDALRQRASAGLMIWSPREILDRALADCETPYQLRDETIRISDCERIPAGTLILTGTPAGVLFHPLSLWNAAAYLRSGDEVVTVGTHLGVLRNEVR